MIDSKAEQKIRNKKKVIPTVDNKSKYCFACETVKKTEEMVSTVLKKDGKGKIIYETFCIGCKDKTKECGNEDKGCGKSKPLGDFNESGSGTYGRHPYCKACRAIERKKKGSNDEVPINDIDDGTDSEIDISPVQPKKIGGKKKKSTVSAAVPIDDIEKIDDSPVQPKKVGGKKKNSPISINKR